MQRKRPVASGSLLEALWVPVGRQAVVDRTFAATVDFPLDEPRSVVIRTNNFVSLPYTRAQNCSTYASTKFWLLHHCNQHDPAMGAACGITS